MTGTPDSQDRDPPGAVTPQKPGRHGVLGLTLAGLVAGMVGLSFAAVPLYRIFCQVTSYDGTPQRADAAPGADEISDRTVDIRFDANVAPGLNWKFEPVQKQMKVRIGASNLAFFTATNLTDKPVTGSAIFNVAPGPAARYFNKIQCFCFTKQTLQPGQTVEMPVTFFVAPEFLEDEDTKNIRDMTLSYTFYSNDDEGVAEVKAAPGKQASGS